MTKGMPPGQCDQPNCPWRYITDPPAGGLGKPSPTEAPTSRPFAGPAVEYRAQSQLGDPVLPATGDTVVLCHFTAYFLALVALLVTVPSVML